MPTFIPISKEAFRLLSEAKEKLDNILYGMEHDDEFPVENDLNDMSVIAVNAIKAKLLLRKFELKTLNSKL